MKRDRLRPTAIRLALVVLASLVVWIGTQGTREDTAAEAESSSLLRPAGGVIGPLPRRRGCLQTKFEGTATPLYADRPYRTSAPVPELEGRVFCRGKRHGQEVWILDVTRPTTLYTLASEAHALETGGWRRLSSPVRVDAAGVVLDRLYARPVEPGRYAIHYGHATTATPVFFDPGDARITPIPARDDG